MNDTYAALICKGDFPNEPSCGQVLISEDEYLNQLDEPDALWRCPHCGSTANFDDEYFEQAHVPFIKGIVEKE